MIEPNSQHQEGWFTFEGVPLKWHYPIGLLFDLYAGAEPATRGNTPNPDAQEDESPLPWRLTVHFSDWPVEDLVRLDPDGMVMNDAFINSVKEADFLRNGTAKGIMSLSKEDSSGLWKAVENGNLPTPRLKNTTDLRYLKKWTSHPSSVYQTPFSLRYHNRSATYLFASSFRFRQMGIPHH